MKYESLIEKIQDWQKDPHYSTFNFNSAEKELILDALETVQFLEMILQARKESLEKKLETYE